MKEFSGSYNIQRDWNYCQGLIHNTYHGENIKTDHHAICSMSEYATQYFELTNFTTPVLGILMEFIDKGTILRYKFPSMGYG